MSVSATDPNIQAMIAALKNAGFSGSNLVTMTSLGISESGGNSKALNNNPATGDYSVGWFQINYFNGLNASRTAEFGSPQDLLNNPQWQAAAAFKLSGGGQTFSPWQGDYNNGSYYRNLPTAQAAVNAFLGGATATAAPGSPIGTTGTNLAATSSSSNCLVPWPSVNLGVTSVGGGCFISKIQAQHILGGLCMFAGVCIAGVGAIMLVRNESNPYTAVRSTLPKVVKKSPKRRGSTKKKNVNKQDEISEKEFRAAAGGRSDEELKAVSAQNKSSKKADEKRRTFDAKTNKNYLDERPDDF